jgi:hypothetical protein
LKSPDVNTPGLSGSAAQQKTQLTDANLIGSSMGNRISVMATWIF